MPAQDRVGVTRRWQRSARGRRATSAANTAWCVRHMRGRGLVRGRMATSCRSTRSSTSLVADVRPISSTRPSTCQKIKYSNRSDTLGSCPTLDYRWSATPTEFWHPTRVRSNTLQHAAKPQALILRQNLYIHRSPGTRVGGFCARDAQRCAPIHTRRSVRVLLTRVGRRVFCGDRSPSWIPRDLPEFEAALSAASIGCRFFGGERVAEPAALGAHLQP